MMIVVITFLTIRKKLKKRKKYNNNKQTNKQEKTNKYNSFISAACKR